MATKPTIANARWSDVSGTPAANVVAPLSGTRDVGFQPDDPVPSGIHNFLWRELYRWAIYLDEFLTDAHTWVGTQTFAVLNAVSLALSGALTAATVSTSGNTTVGGQLNVTGNASFGGTAGFTGLTSHNAGASIPTGQTLALAGTAKVSIAGYPLATSTVGFKNEVHAGNTLKAWARVVTTTGGGPTIGNDDHYNLPTATTGHGGDFTKIRVSFPTNAPMANASYGISFGATMFNANTVAVPAVSTQTTTYVEVVVTLHDTVTDTSQIADTTAQDFSFNVFVWGKQT